MNDTTDQAVEPAIADENVKPDASDESVEPKQDAASAPAVVEPDEATEKAKAGIQKRFDELTRDKYSERRAREAAERERDELRARLQQQEKPAQPPSTPKSLKDFDYDEARYAEHLRAEARAEAKQAVAEELAREREKTAAVKRESEWRERVEAFRKDAPDFDDVVMQSDLPITQIMADVLGARADGPAIAYYLGKNRDVAAQIAQLPPGLAGAELGAIAERLKAEKAKPPAVSKAPPPTPRLDPSDGAASVRTTDASGDALSDEEWVRAERKRLARKR
jgi:hypothetical protein